MKRRLLLILASIILCGSTVFAQSNHWSLDNPGAYASHLNTWIAVELDGVRLASTDIELAAFVDGECRGVERLAVYNPDWGYLASIQIFKDNAGDVITFKMYDHATETEYDDCSTTVTTQVAGEEMGATPMDPTVAVFTSPEPVEPTGPEHPWVPASFPSNMSIFAEIQINGVPQSGDNWEVGAFCGDECRGDQIGTVVAPTEFGQMLSMVVYGENGDVISFYLYDIANQSIVGSCSTTVTYVEQGNAGVVWDPLILNFITEEPCFTLDITGYGTGTGNYYLIASPIDGISPEEVVFIMDQEESTMTAGEFDLYYFDQNKPKEWINYQEGEGSTDPGFNLVSGTGYLYANKQSGTLKFCGTPISGDSYEVTLHKNIENNPEGSFEGWNLVGNPFTETAYIDRDFYIMNGDGTEIIAAADENVESIERMQGVFVVAEEEGETLTFSKEPVSNNNSKLVISMKQERGNVIDRAIVRFNTNRTLPKFMLNDNSTKLYIPQDNHEFAVVSADNETEEMPLSFKASVNGTYTLTVNVKDVTFEHLTLIDHLTGAEVNLLATPNYQFNAKTIDPAARFTLLFKSNSNVSTAEQFNPILYRQNGQLTINGIEGDYELQMIDLLGRVISSTTVNGDFNQTINVAPGVYSIRLNTGDKTYTQKIVVE